MRLTGQAPNSLKLLRWRFFYRACIYHMCCIYSAVGSIKHDQLLIGAFVVLFIPTVLLAISILLSLSNRMGQHQLDTTNHHY